MGFAWYAIKFPRSCQGKELMLSYLIVDTVTTLVEISFIPSYNPKQFAFRSFQICFWNQKSRCPRFELSDFPRQKVTRQARVWLYADTVMEVFCTFGLSMDCWCSFKSWFGQGFDSPRLHEMYCAFKLTRRFSTVALRGINGVVPALTANE